jgi:CxC4 like cysteine cluster associated with KDZ transposases
MQGPTVRNRAIVQYEGADDGTGTWSCSKDPSATSCAHIHSANRFLNEHYGTTNQIPVPQSRARLHYDGMKFLRSFGRLFTEYDHPATRIRSPRRQIPISHCRRAAPVWASLDIEEDTSLRCFDPRPDGDTSPIHLDMDSACVCMRTSSYNPLLGTSFDECTIYGLSKAWKATVEVQQCGACWKRKIGPDSRHLGLFNWNNHIIFAEDLLDDYTSSFVASETPFVAYTSVVSRRYATHKSPIPFVPDKLFREIWFGYILLLGLDLKVEAMCPSCGPTPKTTIWDGVTLAFGRKHIQNTLEPPTTLVPDSSTRSRVRYVYTQQCIPRKELRSLLRKILTGASLVGALKEGGLTTESSEEEPPSCETDGEGGTDNDSGAGQRRKAAAIARKEKEYAERLAAIPGVIMALRALDQGLATNFDRWFGLAAISTKCEAPSAYQRFFKQVSPLQRSPAHADHRLQVIAEESILQMINRPALTNLGRFNSSPSLERLSNLIVIPTVYDVLRYDHDTTGSFDPATLQMCLWLYKRGQEVLEALLRKNGPDTESELAPDVVEKDWRHVNDCFLD